MEALDFEIKRVFAQREVLRLHNILVAQIGTDSIQRALQKAQDSNPVSPEGLDRDALIGFFRAYQQLIRAIKSFVQAADLRYQSQLEEYADLSSQEKPHPDLVSDLDSEIRNLIDEAEDTEQLALSMESDFSKKDNALTGENLESNELTQLRKIRDGVTNQMRRVQRLLQNNRGQGLYPLLDLVQEITAASNQRLASDSNPPGSIFELVALVMAL